MRIDPSKRVDAAWLSAFRILFGTLMCISMCRFLAYGWVQRFFVDPNFHFKYRGFEWVEPLTGGGMHALFGALAVLAACMTVGLFFRTTALLFSVGLAYFQLIDVSTYLNHYYLAALLSLLLAMSPAHRVWSVDAWWERRRGRDRAPFLAAGWLYLLRFQVGAVYFFAGLAKFNSDWLVHAQPLRIWLGAKTDLPLLGPLFTVEPVPLVMSWAGFLFDTTIVLWLSLRRTRRYAFLVVIAFHSMTALLFPIGMFPFIMTTAALVFFEPTWPRTVLLRLLAFAERLGLAQKQVSVSHRTERADRERGASSSKKGRTRPGTTVVGALALLYCLTQLILPLRYLAYPGNVMWHEQGMRFSWRVMLRAKGGSTRFIVKERGTDRVVHVDPSGYLSDLQEAEMVSQPDLLLQMAHHIAHDYEKKGFRNVQVYAQSRVALNGRRSRVFVDPHVDLAAVRETIRPYAWITDAPTQPPPHTRPVL